ncbi:hypothetical protein [Pseudochrobactrum sp. B5]|uniref:hypothetical protein n=1 Tax=Pseudochrobactrum sp. B5 TaxID=1289478 RepID=UPI000A679185|nr:hypothetical protein [Pseudochrobactrum sp. B5]
MWASKTCYSKLNKPDYSRKIQDSASFKGSAFEQSFLSFCQDMNISAIVDISSGGGRLKEIAEGNALKIAACGYMPPHSEIIHFDLASSDTNGAKLAINAVQNIWGGQEYVTTCIDVLERIDVEDIPSAIFNLFDVSNEFVIVSISTRPSSHRNAYSSTILPISTWTHLLETAGFEVLDEKFAAEGRRVISKDNVDATSLLVTQWAKADVFRDRLAGEPTYLLLRKFNSTDRDLARERIERVLDIAYRKIKRAQFVMPQSEIIAFNIHHIQDFFNIRPLLDVIARDACVVFLRDGVLKEDEDQLVTGFFFRCGVMLVKYAQVEEIDWRLLMVETLISAAESTAAFNHALSSQLVEAAKLNGVRTILLQHGIWIESMRDRQISFSSDYVLSWGREHETFFKQAANMVAGQATSVGCMSSEFIAAGSPKFCDSQISPNADVLRWRLGLEPQNYRKTVLIGTNLKWSAHKVTSSRIISGIHTMIEQNPDVLFVVKPHPSERSQEYSDLKFSNSVVLDDIILGCADVSISRIIGGVSTVISSLSTLILDGAVSGKRCIQYDTGSSVQYDGCKPFDVSRLNFALRDDSVASIDGADFKRIYNDADNLDFYKVFSNVLVKKKHATNTFRTYSLLKSVEDCWNIIKHNQNDLLQKTHQSELQAFQYEQLMRKHEQLVRQHEGLTERCDQLAKEHDELIVEKRLLKDERDALFCSTSWRITAPYRWLGRLLQRR